MRLKYLGTGAAEGIPALFCECSVCIRSMEEGGKSLRMRSCSMLGEELMIDLSPDIYAQKLRYCLRLDKLKSIVFTHSHPDHEDLYALQLWGEASCALHPQKPEGDVVLDLYGERRVRERFEQVLGEANVLPQRFRFHEVKHFEPFCASGYTFYPLRANHRPKEVEDCMVYAISDGKTAILYANDTGELAAENDLYLSHTGLRFSLVSMDCARGPLPGDGHMSFAQCLALRKRLERIGAADEHTRYIVNHLSHMAQMTHREWQEYAAPYNIDIAWDGREIEC